MVHGIGADARGAGGSLAPHHLLTQDAEPSPAPSLMFCCRWAQVLAMIGDQKPHFWVRSVLIGCAIFAAWLIVGVATYQESPDDTPIIVALFSK